MKSVCPRSDWSPKRLPFERVWLYGPPGGRSLPFGVPVVASLGKGRSHLVRLHFPGGKALEVQSFRWEAQDEQAVEWEFTKK